MSAHKSNNKRLGFITIRFATNLQVRCKNYKLYGLVNHDYMGKSKKRCGPTLILAGHIHCDLFELRISAEFDYYYIVINNDLLNIFDGNCKMVVIDERTTIASVFCFAQFMTYHKSDLVISGKPLSIPYGMRNNFILDNGLVSEVIKSSPNGLETNSYPLFNFLANILYHSLRNQCLYSRFLKLTNSDNLICGLLSMALNPFLNVDKLFYLFVDTKPIFKPSLQNIVLPHWKKTVKPNQWTLTLKFNNSGSKNFIIGGPGYITFDKDNKVWLNNNVRQGTPNSSTFCTILESNGKPAEFSPLFGGGLLGAGFGIATNMRKDIISIGNFGWGSTDCNPQNGSISTITSDGKLISPSNGFTSKSLKCYSSKCKKKSTWTRAQGIHYDCNDNLWIASWGSQKPLGGADVGTFNFESSNSSVVVYIKGDPNKMDIYGFDNEFFGTFDVVADNKGNIFASNAGNESNDIKSSLFHFRLIDDKIIKINSWFSDKVEAFRQVTIGPKGNIFVAAVITSRVLKFDVNLKLIGEFTNKIDGPWGITFDKCGTMYIANFRRDTKIADLGTFDMVGSFGVTIICNQDDSTAKLIDLPTGGNQVMLSNGFPLYGSNSRPSFEPLMRITGTGIDTGGNLWALNNWKPSLINNFTQNPGGDGVVVFIGLASI